MAEQIKHSLLSLRDLLITAGPFIALALLVLGLAYWIVDPAPPKNVVLATGPENSDYYVLAKRYQAFLAKHHIQLELRKTEGSRENLQLLLDQKSGVSLALMRSGTTVDEDLKGQNLTSIGSLFYEPVWLFHRSDIKLESLKDLRGKRVEAGPPGDGAGKLVDLLLKENGMTRSDLQLSRAPLTEAVIALLESKADVLILVSGAEAHFVQMLLKTPGISLHAFPQAQAYSRKLPNLSAVHLPRGIVDLAQDEPTKDVPLLAPTATLVHNDKAHAALVDLLIQAARDIHSQPSWLSKAREFPNIQNVEIPISKEAVRFYQSGAPFLQRYLPFWLANLIDRMWVVLLSIGALLIPLSRILPPLYQWRIRSRIYRWYAELKDVEKQSLLPLSERTARQDQDMFERLDDIEDKVNNLKIPLSHADIVYQMRSHIALVRERLKHRR